MARGNQTFQKRQRENKLREKAQQKRERREQRRTEKKAGQAPVEEAFSAQPIMAPAESGMGNDPFAGETEFRPLPGMSTAEVELPDLNVKQTDPRARRNVEESMSKLFIGNLPYNATDSSLAEFVTSAGFRVASAVVVRDKITGEGRGFGFVELAEGEDFQRAIGGLNGQAMEGRRLNVNEARPQRTGFSGRGGGPGGGRDRDRGRFGGGRGRGY